ncbi:MAG: Gx transporter family protein [Erysipelotrichaceae bacterium]|nr:Gx transporter family protein [Erysipelotrichaceae bacterium]
MKPLKKEIFTALLCAFAILLNILEGQFLHFLPYGLKIGLANIFALVVWDKYGRKEVILLNLLRVVLAALLKGTLFAIPFWISFSGVAMATLTLVLLYKKATLLFASLLAAIMHNFGQLLMVMYFYHQANIAVLLPPLVLIAVPCGLLTAWIASEILKRIAGYD